MPKKNILSVILFLSFLIAACGGDVTAAPETPAPTAVTPTSTPNADPCAAENLPAEITKIQNLMREFDDYATLASNVQQAQLAQVIPDMQRILRWAEDQSPPACLKKLKELQLAHMNTVIETLMAFMRATDQTGMEQINAGIAQARELRLQYDVERARLLGVTLTPFPTPQANIPANITATNAGTSGINLRTAPAMDAPAAGILGAQASVPAFGRTADGQWIQVQIPDKPEKRAWVFASLVKLSVPIEQLPVLTP